MDRKFKWNMFITSFIPLWLSIIVSDAWSVIESATSSWKNEDSLICNLIIIYTKNRVCIIVILVIGVLMLTSIFSINLFLKDKCKNFVSPKIKVNRAMRANKLSSEFLLAYILPMIAFDFAEFKSVVLFAIYFGMLAFLCIRNSNVYTNIWLEFRGYRMYLCDLEVNIMGNACVYADSLVLSKNNLTLKTGNNIECWDFDNYIYIDLR